MGRRKRLVRESKRYWLSANRRRSKIPTFYGALFVMFTLTQWLTLAAGPAIGFAVCYLVATGAGSLVDRDVKRYSQVDKRLEEIRGMPD